MKAVIAEAFLKLSRQKSVDKITVKDLVEACGISRQTFYYHFQDILEVIQWSAQQFFQEVLKRSLEAKTPEAAMEDRRSGRTAAAKASALSAPGAGGTSSGTSCANLFKGTAPGQGDGIVTALRRWRAGPELLRIRSGWATTGKLRKKGPRPKSVVSTDVWPAVPAAWIDRTRKLKKHLGRRSCRRLRLCTVLPSVRQS